MDILFERFAELVQRLGNPPNSAERDEREKIVKVSPSQIFSAWIRKQPQPFVPGTTKRLFRLLFPHEGSRRRYGLREMSLATALEQVLGISGLSRWDEVAFRGRGGTGCLGEEVKLAVFARKPEDMSSMTISDVDALLDQLASWSSWSQLSQTPSPRHSPEVILRRLFRDSRLSPLALSVLTQIILRDLRPIVCPLPPKGFGSRETLILEPITNAPQQLTLETAMQTWDPVMAALYRDGKGDMGWCATTAEAIRRNESTVVTAGPILGVNVKIPKARGAGSSVDSALKGFYNGTTPKAPTVWAETKYDGYRMQIHVALTPHPTITIFSKSKRNSTLERRHTHAFVASKGASADVSIIYAALGLPIPEIVPSGILLYKRARKFEPRFHTGVILEAEVVPYNEGGRDGGRGPGIEEFWHLGSAGVNYGTHGGAKERHLCLAFFDVLYVNGESLLHQPYEHRRAVLETVLQPIEGFALWAERQPIPLDRGLAVAKSTLQNVFDKAVMQHEEGLMLKASTSRYNDWLQWVKMKHSFIRDHGDSIDLVVLGAGWDLDRARILRVDTSVFTTFYFGVLLNKEEAEGGKERPHFQFLFRSSWGMSRQLLKAYNDQLTNGSWDHKPYDKNDKDKRRLKGLSWTFEPLPSSIPPPSVLLNKPLCGEVSGLGFQRLDFCDNYEVRFPSVQKIWDTDERSYIEALTYDGLREVAHKALGYRVPSSPRTDSVEAMWRAYASLPRSPEALKRCATEGSPAGAGDSPSPHSSSGRVKPSPTALRKAQTMREWELAPVPTPGARGARPRHAEAGLWPASPSPPRRRLPPLPQSPSPHRTLTPRTLRASNRPPARLVLSPGRPSPARILTYGGAGAKRPPETDADSLPTPPPSSPTGPRSKRPKLLSDLPVPALSALGAAKSLQPPKSPTKSKSALAPLSARIRPPALPTPALTSPPPVPPSPTAPAPSTPRTYPSPVPCSEDWPASSPLADRVRAAAASRPLKPLPRALSLRSRLRRAGLPVPS